MKRLLTFACLFMALAGPALALNTAATTPPVDSCPPLSAARAQARTLAAANGFTIRDFDGDAVTALVKDPGIIRNTSANQLSQIAAAKHVTVLSGKLSERYVVLFTVQPCSGLEDALALSPSIAMPTVTVPFLNGQF